MRIGLLTRRMDPAGGGTERDFMTTARLLREAGHDLRIYAARSRESSWDGIPIRRVPLAGLGLRTLEVVSFGLLAAGLARREGAELVLSFGRTVDSDLVRYGGGVHRNFLRAARQWQGTGAAIVQAISSYHAAQRWMDRRALNSPRLKMVAAVSAMVGADLTASLGLPAAMVEVVYNGVDLQRFRPSSDREAAERTRRALGLPALPVVLFVGTGFARKGLSFLLRAWPRLRHRAALLVVGRDRTASARELARRLGVADRVTFAGPRQDVPDLMRAADMLVLPSLFEAFGNVVLEALASGLPAICSSRCGSVEVLPPALAPFAIKEPRDCDEIAARMDAMLEAAPADLRQAARAAAEPFTWDRYGAQMEMLIKRIAGS